VLIPTAIAPAIPSAIQAPAHRCLPPPTARSTPPNFGEDVPFVGAFHGLGALVIFGLSGSFAGSAWVEGRRTPAAQATSS
jgi:hypothetical protein